MHKLSGRLGHQALGAFLVERDLEQRIAAHGLDRNDQSVAECLVEHAVAGGMNDAGYTRTDDKDAANVGIQLSYVQKVTYFVGYDYPYWWWYYPYYWAPGYWGDWVGWHYPYSVYYGYTAGSLLLEMLDLEADQETGKKLPVVWDSFIGGLLTSDAELNQQRTIAGVEQAFEQSPYLAK